MNYGYTKITCSHVILRCCPPTDAQLSWANDHQSNGSFNYHIHGIYHNGIPSIKWNFSNPEDAAIFALKFK